jgi:hypothetical protein
LGKKVKNQTTLERVRTSGSSRQSMVNRNAIVPTVNGKVKGGNSF